MLFGQWHAFNIWDEGGAPAEWAGLHMGPGSPVAMADLLGCALLLAHTRHWQHSMLLAALSSSRNFTVSAAVW
jgi:hypothetical protein